MVQRTLLPAFAFPSMHGVCQHLKIGTMYPGTIGTEKLTGNFLPVMYLHSFRIQGYNLSLKVFFFFVRKNEQCYSTKHGSDYICCCPLTCCSGATALPHKGKYLVFMLEESGQIHQPRRGEADATPHSQVQVKGGQVCVPSLTQLLLWFSQEG